MSESYRVFVEARKDRKLVKLDRSKTSHPITEMQNFIHQHLDSVHNGLVDELRIIRVEESCKYCGNPFEGDYRHETCGMD